MVAANATALHDVNAAPKAASVDQYGLHPEFEALVVFYLCTRPGFYGRVGAEVEPDSFGQPAARLAAQAAQAIAIDAGGVGCRDVRLVLQRLARWRDDGRVTTAEIEAVDDLFDLAAQRQVFPNEDEVIAEFSPVIRQILHREAVREAVRQVARKGDLGKVTKLIEAADNVGREGRMLGSDLASCMDALDAAPALSPLSTGVAELDTIMDGGLPRGMLGVVVGHPGGGKSQFLNHAMAHAIARGHTVLGASLELPLLRFSGRLTAALTDIPTNDIVRGTRRGEAQRALAQYASRGMMGRHFLRFFQPRATYVTDLYAWVDYCNEVLQAEDKRVEVLCVDYADKLISKRSAKDKGDEYMAMLDVYEALRLGAVERDIWVWTASQPGRQKGKRVMITQQDLADSQHKARVADVIITLNPERVDAAPGASEPPIKELRYWIAKFRDQQGEIGTDPVSVDWAYGRTCPQRPFTAGAFDSADPESDLPF